MTIKGWVYVISNMAMPGLLKVGFSLKDPALRARELANTGAPHPYRVEYEALLENPREVEQRTHRYLSAKREGREWFRCSLEQAISAIKEIAPTPILLENQYAKTTSAQKPDGEAQKAAVKLKPGSSWPTGTYVGTCAHCGARFSLTLRSADMRVKCPECFRLNDINRFKRHELVI